jgi:hypothetical protein
VAAAWPIREPPKFASQRKMHPRTKGNMKFQLLKSPWQFNRCFWCSKVTKIQIQASKNGRANVLAPRFRIVPMRIDIRVSLVQHESILCHVPSALVGEPPGILLPFDDSSVFSRNIWGGRLLKFPSI